MNPGCRILLVDDDEYYRSALKKVLELLGHQVTEAAEGVGAKHILGVQPFDLLVSDIRMPGLDGVELLKWVKAHPTLKHLPVVLITGFSEIIETTEAFGLGASDFLLKPFQKEDIAGAIGKAVRPQGQAEAEPVDLDDQYCKLPLGDFVMGSKIHFNIFVRISAYKYVRVAYRGEDISLDRIRAYKNKGLSYVYLTREDFARYVGFNMDLARRVARSSAISPEKKRNFLRYSGEVVMESLYSKDVDRESFNMAKSFTETSLSILSESDEAFTILDSLNAHADFLYAHSVGVSLYSVLIAQALGWNSAPMLYKLSVGGLFHDIGLKELPRKLLETPRAAMTQEERKTYETHVVRGMELLNQVSSSPGDAILIAYQHHEDCAGMGYPKKLNRKKIHPLARLVAVADSFCELAIQGPDSPGLAAGEAFARLRMVGEARLDPEYLEGLRLSLAGARRKDVP